MISSTGAKSTLVIDEAGFQQLLAAAFVLQQHNDSLAIKNPRLDSAWIFSQIAEAQTLIRAGSLAFTTGISVIAERLRALTESAGVSICLVSDGCLACAMESGSSANVAGGSIAANSAAATERLKNGKPFHSSDAQKDLRLDLEVCRQQGIQALLAVPIERSGEIGGLVEVRWSRADAFHECDVRSCQLMADLVAELLQLELAETEDSPLAAPVIVKAGVNEHAGTDGGVVGNSPEMLEENESSFIVEGENLPYPAFAEQSTALIEPVPFCRVCGRPFGADETFCGNCSLPRLAASPTEGLQSKWASMWFMQQAKATLRESPDAAIQARKLKQVFQSGISPEENNALRVSQSAQQIQPVFARKSESATAGTASGQHGFGVLKWTGGGHEPSFDANVIAPGSAGRLRNTWRALQSLAARVRANRPKAALVAAGTILALILGIWGLRPAHRASPNQLSWFESLLVEMGLAEPPARAPGYSGAANVRVWVDIHTALYYCSGSDLYGKTPGGHFTTQRAAQQDAFEPATRVACE